MREPSCRSSRKRHISATGLHFSQYITAPQRRRPRCKRRRPATPAAVRLPGRGPGCRARSARDGSSGWQASGRRRKWALEGGRKRRTTSSVAHNTVYAAGLGFFPPASLVENGCSSVSASPGEPPRSSRRCSRVRASRAASAFRSRCVVPPNPALLGPRPISRAAAPRPRVWSHRGPASPRLPLDSGFGSGPGVAGRGGPAWGPSVHLA